MSDAFEIDPSEDALRYWEQYRATGDAGHLEFAKQLWEASLERTAPGSPNRASALTNVANVLSEQHRIGAADDDALDRAIALADEAVGLTPDGTSERSTRASNLAIALVGRYAVRKDRRDLDRAIDTFRQAAGATVAEAQLRSLTNLGSALKARFERFEAREDLDEALQATREAADGTVPGTAEYRERRELLAGTHELRYLADDEPADLDAAIEQWTLALEPAGSLPVTADLLFAAGRAYDRRRRVRGDERDRTQAVSMLGVAYMYGSDDAYRLALEAEKAAVPTPEDGLSADARAIFDQIERAAAEYQRTNGPEWLRRALKGYDLLIEHPQAQRPTSTRAILLSNAGGLHMSQWEHTQSREELDVAVELVGKAVETGRAVGKLDPWHARGLGNALSWRYAVTHEESDRRRALELLEEARGLTGPGDPLFGIIEADLARTYALDAPRPDLPAPPDWSAGQVILDAYEVVAIHAGGGMGLVYKVWHSESQRHLAVKRPRPELFRVEEDKARFEDEAQAWVGLGLHPHVVACDYVRGVDGVPCVFAEYLEEGSLSEWVRDGRLYAGSSEAALRRVLDAAIQLAWALDYAHASGLVHQDVKPANALMRPDGTAKLSDFGLARALTVTREEDGFTLGYASPEQLSGKPVGAATDVWSWAVSVLELFVGEVTWLAGIAAPAALELHLRSQTAAVPEPVVELLRRCFAQDPEARPASMGAVADELIAVYSALTGEPYPRPVPSRVELLADGLSNHALAMLELDDPQSAQRLWEEALDADPQHPQTLYNYGLFAWRAGEATDTALVDGVEAARHDDWVADYLLGLVHLERADAAAAVEPLDRATGAAPGQTEVAGALAAALTREHATIARELGAPDDDHDTAVALSADGDTAVVGRHSGTVVVFEAGALVATLPAEGEDRMALAVGLLGGSVVLGHPDGVTIRDPATCRVVRDFGRAEAFGAWAFTGSIGAAACDDGRIEIWDLQVGRVLRAVEGTGDVPAEIAVTDGGRLVAAVGNDEIVRVYDTVEGRTLYAFRGHKATVSAVAITPAGTSVVSGAHDGVAMVWDLGTGRPGRPMVAEGGGPIWSIALSADGATAVTGTAGSLANLEFPGVESARVWETGAGRCLSTLPTEGQPIRAVALAAGGRVACTVGGGAAVLWTLGRSRRAPWSYARTEDSAARIARSDAAHARLRRARELVEGGRIAEAAAAVEDLRRTPGFARHPAVLEFVRGLAAHGTRDGLRSAFSIGRLPVRRDQLRERANRLGIPDLARLTLRIHRGDTLDLALADDASTAVSAHSDGTARAWDLRAGRSLPLPEPHPTAVMCVAISPDGRCAASSSGSTLRIWDSATGEAIITLGEEWHMMVGDVAEFPFIVSAALGDDGRLALSGHHNGTIDVWDVATGERRHTLAPDARASRAACPVALSADGRRALAGTPHGAVALHDLDDGRCLWSVDAHTAPVVAVGVSSEGTRGFSADQHGMIRTCELDDGRVANTVETVSRGDSPVGRTYVRGHAVNEVGERGAVAVSGDAGFALAAGPSPNTLSVWDLENGRRLETLQGHASAISAVALSRDGFVALSASSDGDIRSWHLDWDVT